MKEELKLIMFQKLYKYLELNKVEDIIRNAGIPSKEIENPDNIEIPSKYFFLKNDIHLENLEESELEKLNQYYQYYLQDKMHNRELLENYLMENIKLLLIPNIPEKFIYYGQVNNLNHASPTSAIAIAFHYLRYADEGLSDSQMSEIIDQANYIQEELAKEKKLKLRVLLYDELVPEMVRKL